MNARLRQKQRTDHARLPSTNDNAHVYIGTISVIHKNVLRVMITSLASILFDVILATLAISLYFDR